jgi:hypothetical protein
MSTQVLFYFVYMHVTMLKCVVVGQITFDNNNPLAQASSFPGKDVTEAVGSGVRLVRQQYISSVCAVIIARRTTFLC